jgi:hypothetical protein
MKSMTPALDWKPDVRETIYEQRAQPQYGKEKKSNC